MSITERSAHSSSPEDQFVQLFAEVFGLEKTQLITPQFPFIDILGKPRYIDFALRTPVNCVAIEVDGLQHFSSIVQIDDDQMRQNSLVHLGWQVFRWSERAIRDEPERIKDELLLFLSNIPGLLNQDSFLPRQTGSVIELREYQQEAILSLQQARERGETIALLTHATGTGKTVVALHDARNLNLPTLYLAHCINLIHQTEQKLSELWPEASYCIYQGSEPDSNCQVVLSTVQRMARNLNKINAKRFKYLIIDEAHRAQSESYKAVLKHFESTFTLGLTATPERMDSKSLLELFENTAHRLNLEQAIKIEALVPIRCIRVKTNVDLTKVRFNQIQYHAKDLEVKVMTKGRNELIVETYKKHVTGKRAVVFAVNVRHAEELAEMFQIIGVPAASVSGGDSFIIREQRLKDFASGHLYVLCACDILNEGWDCPAVEVLFMARPTLSRIVYLQQLGRGTRRSPATGKKYLLVFDFVDNPSRYNAAITLHGITNTKKYTPGSLVLASDEEVEKEKASFAKKGSNVIPIANR